MDATFTPHRLYLGDGAMVTRSTRWSVAAFDSEDRVLLICAEGGSTPADALCQLCEETGMDAEFEQLVGAYENEGFGSLAAFPMYFSRASARGLATERRRHPARRQRPSSIPRRSPIR